MHKYLRRLCLGFLGVPLPEKPDEVLKVVESGEGYRGSEVEREIQHESPHRNILSGHMIQGLQSLSKKPPDL
jgi:hypothetical protein